MSEDGRYFSITQKKRNAQEYSILVVDLETKISDGLDPQYAKTTVDCPRDFDEPYAWVKGNKIIATTSSGDNVPSFIFDMNEKLTWNLVNGGREGNRRREPSIISCCCLSACGKVLAVKWESSAVLGLYCFETGLCIGKAYEGNHLDDYIALKKKVTEIFFPTSTIDVIGVVQTDHVYILPIEYRE